MPGAVFSERGAVAGLYCLYLGVPRCARLYPVNRAVCGAAYSGYKLGSYE